MQLAADSMLGRLAKYLRLCGIDTTYFANIDDRVLIEHALATGRVLLTRDTLLMKRREITRGEIQAVFINSDKVKNQLKQCFAELAGRGFDLSRLRPSSRCSICNSRLEAIFKPKAFGLIPSFVIAQTDRFYRCPECSHIYWTGSHSQHFFKILEELGPGNS